MSYKKLKIALFTISVTVIALNSFLYFGGEAKKKNNAIQSAKMFNIEIKDAENNNFSSLISKNNISDLEKYNKHIPNLSILFFDLLPVDLENLIEISDIIINPRFAFSEFNKNLLEEFKKNQQNILIKISLNNDGLNRIDELSSKNQKIVINSNYLLEENQEIFNYINRLKEEYNVSFYIDESDLMFLNGNADLTQIILNLRPFLINKNQACNSSQNFCFFFKNYSESSILDSLNDLKKNITNEKIENKNMLINIENRNNLVEFSNKIKDIIYNGEI